MERQAGCFQSLWCQKPAKKADEADDVDIFSVADICDVGEGVPLFEMFTADDWQLLQLRFEFALLCHSFKTDCNDPDRAGIPVDHVGFYYHRYYGHSFTTKQFGMDDMKAVCGLIKDVVSIKEGLVQLSLDDIDSLDIFAKLTEEGRRERQRRLDAGDETARLKFLPPVEHKPKPAPEAKPAAEPKVVPAKVAPSGGAKGGVVAPSGSAAGGKPAAVVVPAKGKDDKGKGKDWGKGDQKGWGKDDQKGWGKDQQKGWGKDGGKDQGKGWGKDGGKGGKDQKGWGKGGGKW